MVTRRKFFSAAALASASGALFASAPALAGSGSEAKVKCYGVNKCKGHNDCKTANNACKGHASCKGQGFVKMSEHACDAIGGSVNKPAE